MKTAEGFWESKHGGKSPHKATEDGELVTPVHAIIMMESFAEQVAKEHAIEFAKYCLLTGQWAGTIYRLGIDRRATL